MCSSSGNKSTPVQKEEPKTTQQTNTQNETLGGAATTQAPVTATTQEQPKQQTEASTTPLGNTAQDSVSEQSAAQAKNKRTGLAGRDIRTAARGLRDLASSKKKELLGG